MFCTIIKAGETLIGGNIYKFTGTVTEIYNKFGDAGTNFVKLTNTTDNTSVWVYFPSNTGKQQLAFFMQQKENGNQTYIVYETHDNSTCLDIPWEAWVCNKLISVKSY